MKEIILPKTKEELKKLIKKEMKSYGIECDLNHIDTSLITDMSWLFDNNQFNGNISQWNVSNVKNMSHMFYNSQFNRDISHWDLSNVEDMSGMFYDSKFNREISEWNTINVKNMSYMFYNSQFNEDISHWDVSQVNYMNYLFSHSKFNQDLSLWKPYSLIYCENMVSECPIKVPYWYSEDCNEIRFKLKDKEVKELSLMLDDNNIISQPKNKL